MIASYQRIKIKSLSHGANLLAYRISKSIRKFVRFTQKSLATRKLSIQNKIIIPKEYFDTKIICQEMPTLVLGAKNPTAGFLACTKLTQENFSCFGPSLLEHFTTRKLSSFTVNILKVI